MTLCGTDWFGRRFTAFGNRTEVRVGRPESIDQSVRPFGCRRDPRVFPPARSIDTWASRGVLGEEYWSAHRRNPISAHHRVAPIVLGVMSAAGVPFWAWGLIVLDPWITAFGLAVQMLCKVWFIDRMALLYDDVRASSG